MLRMRTTQADPRPNSFAATSQAGAARYTRCTTMALEKSSTAFEPQRAYRFLWVIRTAVGPCLLGVGVLLKARAAGINLNLSLGRVNRTSPAMRQVPLPGLAENF